MRTNKHNGLRLLLACLLCSGTAQALQLDLSHCKNPDPQGRAYIALGETVLRVDVSEVSMTHAPPPNTPRPPAPDPSDPVGCKGNPLLQQSLIHAFSFNAWRRDRHHENSASVLSQMRLISTPVDYPPAQMQQYHPYACERLTRRVQLANGLEGCLPPATPEHPDREQMGSYQAPRERYALPLDQTFQVTCLAGIAQGVECKVRYKLTPTLTLFYRFDTEKLPLEELIEFDRNLASSINNVIDHEYSWGTKDGK